MNFVIIAAEIFHSNKVSHTVTARKHDGMKWKEKKRQKKIWSMFDPRNQSKNDTVAKSTLAAKS